MAEAIVLEWVLPQAVTAVITAVAGPPGRAVWGAFTGVLTDQADLQAALDGKLAVSTVGVTVQGYSVQLATVAGLSPADDEVLQRKAGAWTSRTPAQFKTDLNLVKGDVGLGNVENTALSSWAGSGAVTTLGTVTSGSWTAGAVAPAYGGTGLTGYAAGDLVYAAGAGTLARLADVAVGSVLVSGGVAAPPAWGKVGLASHVSGVLPIASGGTGQTGATAALNALLPSQAGAGGKFLTSDGTNPAWGTPVTAWGGVTGTLSSQTDLQAALDAKLGLSGGTMTGALGAPAGAVGTPGLFAAGDPNTGLWFPAADTLAASVGGVEAWRADSSARLGVGMTTLSAQFSVQSGVAARVAQVIKGAASQSANLMEWQTSGGTLLAAVDAGGHIGLNKCSPSATAVVAFMSGNNERIDTTGNAYGIQAQVINAQSGNATALHFSAESRYAGGGAAMTGLQGGCVLIPASPASASSMQALFASTPSIAASSTVATVYGVRIDPQKVTGATIAYGLYSGGANDINFFAGTTTIGNLAGGLPGGLTGPALVLANVSTPPTGNPVSGGTLYSEGGSLKWRGAGGTTTTIAVA